MRRPKRTKAGMAKLRRHIQELLAETCTAKKFDFHLTAGEPIIRKEDKDAWVVFVVEPDREDVRLYEYVDVLATVEETLWDKEHEENVRLLPALPY